WQGVALESWSGARLADIRPAVTLEGADGRVHIEVGLAGETRDLSLRVSIDDITETMPVSTAPAAIDLRVQSPQLWWPHHLGSQPLYGLEVELLSDDTVIDYWRREIGFRSIRLNTTADEHGSAFTLI